VVEPHRHQNGLGRGECETLNSMAVTLEPGHDLLGGDLPHNHAGIVPILPKTNSDFLVVRDQQNYEGIR